MSTRVGFIGLGSQGAPIARRIVDASGSAGGPVGPVTLWARRNAALEPFAGTAAKTAGSPAELARESDIIGICVTGDADVEAVTDGDDGILAGAQPGAIIAVHSTVHPDTCRRLAARAAELGAHVIDAPVSGGAPAAEAGTLLVMVGGDEETVERVRPVLETFGNPVVHLGPLGAGQVTKLLNNTVFTAHLAVASSLFAFGQSMGIEPARLGEVLRHGSSRSFAIEALARAGGTTDLMATHAGPLLRKDVTLTAGVAAAAGVTPGFILDAADVALDQMHVSRRSLFWRSAVRPGQSLANPYSPESLSPRGTCMPQTPDRAGRRAADKVAVSAIGRAPGDRGSGGVPRESTAVRPRRGRPPGRHLLLELGFAVREDGQRLRGEAKLTPFLHAPGTSHLRTSVLATWADQVAGLLALRDMSPRVPVTLDLDVHLYRPAPGAGRVQAVGRTVKTGRSVYVCEVVFTDEAGQAFAISTASFMASPDASLTAPAVTSIDAPPAAARLAMPLAARAGLKRESAGLAVLPRSEDGLNSSNTVNGGLLALCAEEAVLSLALGDTLSSLSLRYLGPVRTGPAVALADLRSGLAQVEIRDSGRENRLAITATARTFARI